MNQSFQPFSRPRLNPRQTEGPQPDSTFFGRFERSQIRKLQESSSQKSSGGRRAAAFLGRAGAARTAFSSSRGRPRAGRVESTAERLGEEQHVAHVLTACLSAPARATWSACSSSASGATSRNSSTLSASTTAPPPPGSLTFRRSGCRTASCCRSSRTPACSSDSCSAAASCRPNCPRWPRRVAGTTSRRPTPRPQVSSRR